MAYEGMIAETNSINGNNGEIISAYVARPLGPGPFPGIVLIHHAPGWDEWYRETTRKFAHHGYAAISHNLFHRAGEGRSDDVAAKVRAEGGVPDAQVIGDTEGAVAWLRAQPYLNGKVGVLGTCSGGRHTFLFACHTKSVDAAVELWGGRVVMSKEERRLNSPPRQSSLRRTFRARCSACSATKTGRLRQRRWRCTKLSSRNTARTTSSTAMTAPDTASFITTGRCIA